MTQASVPISKQFGSVMIIIGTEVGAGILALPIISAKLGFITGSIVMVLAWFIMTYTAILIADIAISLPNGTSFATMAKSILGRPGAVVAWITFLMLMYTISVAYISAAGSIFNHLLSFISERVWDIIFVIVFASIVVAGTRTVDILNSILLSIKLAFLLVTCVALLSLVELPNLFYAPVDLSVLLIAIPVMVTSYTSHIVVPLLTDYLSKDPKVIFRVIMIGSTIPLILYFLWLAAVLGVLPLTGEVSFMNTVFQHQSETTANIGNVLNALHNKIHEGYIVASVDVFVNIAVMTSYLGVSLSLYHFNVDSYNLTRFKPVIKTAFACLLTFLLPLIIVEINSNLFVSALGYVGLCVAVLLIILPACMAIQLSRKNHKYNYKITTKPYIWYICMISGISIILIKLA